MDTVTHLAIGACLGAVTSANKLGKKAVVVGAVAQTIPDIDTVSALWLDPASSVVSHRFLTHSISFAISVAIVLGFAGHRWISGKMPVKAWMSFFLLQLAVHLLLDCFNVYGVAWAAPFYDHRISFNALFVADPFLTIPLVVAAVLTRVNWEHRQLWARIGVLTTAFYLVYALVNKQIVDRAIERNIVSDSKAKQEYLSTPTPFNVWLWYVVVKRQDDFLIGYRSVFDADPKIDFVRLPRQDSLLQPYLHRPDVNKLINFSKGYFAAQVQGDTLVFSDLRFGQIHGWRNTQSAFMFYYFVTPHTADNRTVMQRGRAKGWTWETVEKMAARIRGRKKSNV